MNPDLRIEVICRGHRRDHFDCGTPVLNDYLKRYARQNTDLGISRTYVLFGTGCPDVLGYYSIATGSVNYEHLPAKDSGRLPRYPIPTGHLARLAVHKGEQGKGLGAILLADAIKRLTLVAEQVGMYAITVDAKDEAAKRFYLKFGFTPLSTGDRHLYMLMQTAKQLL